MMKKIGAIIFLMTFLMGVCFFSCPLTYSAQKADTTIAQKENALVNINAAEAEMLISVRGIGPKLAERIVAYRNEFGPFRTAEEIKNVPGIGDVKYNQIKAAITV